MNDAVVGVRGRQMDTLSFTFSPFDNSNKLFFFSVLSASGSGKQLFQPFYFNRLSALAGCAGVAGIGHNVDMKLEGD